MNPEIANLIKNYQENNDDDALLEIWQRLQPILLTYMKKFYVTSSQWDDVCQDAFLKLLECAQKYDPSTKVPFESFYKMQLHYWFLDRIKKRKPDLAIVDNKWTEGKSMIDQIVSSRGNAEEIIEKEEMLGTLKAALETLTEKQKEAVIMFYFKNKSLTEVAEKLGCSYGVASKHKAAGLKKLKDFHKTRG